MAESGAESLTRRERDVLRLLCSGVIHDREIAEQLVISPWTAHYHVAHLRSKLAASNRAQIVAFALAHGVLAAD